MTASQKLVSHEATSRNTRHATGFMFKPGARAGGNGQNPMLQQFARVWALLLVLAAVVSAAPAAKAANQFVPVAGLTFSMTYTGDNPLSQAIAINSTGTPIYFTASVSTNSGGSWLSVTPSYYGSGYPTPVNITVSANPAVTLAAGTYTGSVTVAATGVPSMAIPVTLVIHSPTDTYFDQIAGGLTFSMLTSGNAPPGQALQVRSANSNSVAWTATTSTSDGGSWLNISSAGGTAPSNQAVSITPGNLPGTGGTAGTFTGEVLFTTSGSTDTVSVPIIVNVGSNVLQQVNPLNFNKVFAGPNPLAQAITIAGTGSTATYIVATVGSSTGVPTTGTSAGVPWLTVTPSYYGSGYPSPINITVAVNPLVTLPAGTYMAEVFVTQASSYGQLLTIPVSLTIYPSSSSTYFDNVAGALNYSTVIEGEAPPSQDVQIRNAGGGTLDWTAAATTDDGGSWLTVSSASGTATADLSVTVNPANIPGAGVNAGTFIGQVVLQSSTSRVTIPISYSVGTSVFRQVNPLNFTMVLGGANPLSQVVNIASTGAGLYFVASVISSTGVPSSGTSAGTPWLTITPSYYGSGYSAPHWIEVSVNPAVTLGAGTYNAEILVQSSGYTQQMTIPVTLTIQPPSATFFDATPGQMTFFMATGGTAPPAQVLPIRNAGEGTLDWTATPQTSDGGNWLSVSADSGTAPSLPTVSVNPANIPGGGRVAGTFTGQILLEENGKEISVPVSFSVGANVFEQINPLNFTMVEGGANPLPQVITAASTGTNFYFTAVTANSTGGSWLAITPSYYGSGYSTPLAVQVSVTTSPTMTAGVYSSEVVLLSTDGSQSVTVPVTLTVEPSTAAFFDSLPGQLTFSMLTKGGSPASNPPPSQPLPIRNAGAGTLEWTATVSTADGGAWLAISAASGTAPSVPQLSVIPANIPNAGLVAGTFTGQVILQTTGDTVTIPVTYTVGASVFNQINGLNFNMRLQGANPLPQLLNITSTGSAIYFVGTAASSTGTPTSGPNAGKPWLVISPSYYGSGFSTPIQLIVSVNPAVTLGAGTYTSEIILVTSGYTGSMVIPVTLTIDPPSATFFDDLPGAVTFTQVTRGTGPASQSFAIRNAGAGTLNWTATASTADGGQWLNISSASGTAPDSLTVSINSANLPNQALIAGAFSGQIVLTSGTDRATIPVAMVVGENVLEPVAPITFTKPYAGANPGDKVFNVESAGANIYILGQAASGNGGAWLSTVPSNFGSGYLTPLGIEAFANSVATLVPNTYLGEVMLWTSTNDQGLVVPVTLTVYSVPAATPKFSIVAGTYTTPQTVAVTTTTPNATIYYTINDAAPSTAATKYTGPVKVGKSQVLKAIAYANYYLPSAVATASYVIGAATPVIKPGTGTYETVQLVKITCTTLDSTIYYTINGTTPTNASTKYTKEIVVGANETIEAAAYATGYAKSAVATAKFTIKLPAATPTLSKSSNKYLAPFSLTITDATKGAVIYYTTNDKTPTTASTKYTKAFMVTENETVKAVAIAPGGTLSPVAAATYIITAATPVIKPDGGAIVSGSKVTITDTSAGATIYYTTTNTTPTTASKKYTGPITVTAAETIKAIAAGPNYAQSAVASAKFTIK
jgi:hypothetical protein